jgi:ABC-2 type transport system permease protein
MLNKIFAILKKDFFNESSYRTAFVSSFIGVVMNLLIFYFIDKLFGPRIAPHLQPYSVGFFPYVMLNMGFFHYIGLGAGSYAARIRQEQMQGTLESLLLTPTRTPTLLLGMGLWNFCYATINALIYAGLGYWLFQIDFSQVNRLSLFVILIVTIISFSSIGIISASIILVVKKGNPVEWMLNSAEAILGGVYFPITVMHISLQAVAQCLPMTYAIRALQLAVYQGYTLSALRTEILVLVFFSAALAPLSVWIFSKALDHVRRRGSLAHY